MLLRSKYNTFIMADLPHLSQNVLAARDLVKASGISYSQLAKKLGVQKNMVGMVLTNRRTSRRVLEGVCAVCRERIADNGRTLQMDAEMMQGTTRKG